jgi:hypothetical protein
MANSDYEVKPEISGRQETEISGKQETINIVLWTPGALKGAPSFGLTTKQHAPETQTASAYQPAPHPQ